MPAGSRRTARRSEAGNLGGGRPRARGDLLRIDPKTSGMMLLPTLCCAADASPRAHPIDHPELTRMRPTPPEPSPTTLELTLTPRPPQRTATTRPLFGHLLRALPWFVRVAAVGFSAAVRPIMAARLP